MTIFTKLELYNFRQYKGKHTVDFTKGFNLIEGLNDLGKSGILYAILFALYKYRSGYSKSSDLITFGKNEMGVSLEYISSVVNKKYRITRFVKNDNLDFLFQEYNEDKKEWTDTMSSEIHTPEIVLINEIAKTIGLNKKTFLSVAYAKQKEFYSIISGGSAVKKDLDNILGINASIILRDILRKLISDYQNEIKIETELQQQYIENKEEKESVEKQIKINKKEEADLENKINIITEVKNNINQTYILINNIRIEINSIINNENQIISLEETINEYKTNHKNIIKEYKSKENIEKEIKTLTNKQVELNKSLEKYITENTSKNKEIGMLQQEINTINTTITEFESLDKKAECPTCHQKVSKEHIITKMNEYKEQIDKKDSKLQLIQKEINNIQNNIKEIKVEITSVEISKEKYNQILTQINSLESNIKGFNQKADQIIEENNQIINKIDNLMNRLDSNWIKTNFEKELPKSLNTYNEEEFDIFIKEFTPIIEKIISKYNSIEDELKPLEQHLSSIKGSLETNKKLLDNKTNSIKRLETRIEEIKNIKNKLQHLMKNESVIINLSEKIRKTKLHELAKRTYYWYKKLVSNVRYRSITIDSEDYSLQVIPIESEEDVYFPAKSHIGGGNETILALALRIALAELLKFRSILILDEPTDATDSENIKTLIEGLSNVTNNFEQLILITHHGAGENLANNIIQVKNDTSKNTSYISQT